MHPTRLPNRLQGYNYSNNALYFVTSCVHNRICCFGEIKDGQMLLNQYGQIADLQWQWLKRQYMYVVLHSFIVMPNHIHGVIEIDDRLVGTGRDLSIDENDDHTTGTGHDLSIDENDDRTTGTGHDLSIDENDDRTTGTGHDLSIDENDDRTTGTGHDLSIDENDDHTTGTGHDLSIDENDDHTTGTGHDLSIDETDDRTTGTGHDLSLRPKIKSLSELIGAYKTTTSKQIHLLGLEDFKWQRSFHDHIIRNEESYLRIVNYIENNPLNWKEDKFYDH